MVLYMIQLENIIFQNILQKTCYFKEIGNLTCMNYNKNKENEKKRDQEITLNFNYNIISIIKNFNETIQ